LQIRWQGTPNVLLRDSLGNLLAQGGIQVPEGTSSFHVVGYACASRTPDCQKISAAVKAGWAAAARADANGKATLPGVTARTYYLMISTRYNNQPLVWDMPVHLKAGANALTLDRANASLVK